MLGPVARPETEKHERRGALSPRRVRIAVVAGPDEGRVVEPAGREPLVVGTASDTDLVLSDPSVSRYHLELRRAEHGIRVEDLGSLNGTYLGEAQIRIERGTVHAGTRLELGQTTIEVQDGEAVDDEPDRAPPIPGMVARSAAMQQIATTVHRLADKNVSVLVQGETGTGKEVVARAIHDLSARASAPFEVVDCGSLAPTLVASELFGHERGAFTGADRAHAGAFARADGGTLFLDEIGELPRDIQPVLLGVLERRRFRPLGGSKERWTDVRVVAATHRDLRSAVNDGSFRADLYYRLAVARLVIPPLRDRPEDVDALVEHFVRELADEPGPLPFGDAALDALREQRWPGNARELRNVVESALAMGRLEVGGVAVDEPGEDGERTVPYRDARAAAIARFEKRYLSRLIEDADHNASLAARRAKMDRPYLLTLLRKHGLR
jgi:DNA-binding NtrC family response regulator